MQLCALPWLADFQFSLGRGQRAAMGTAFIVQRAGGGDVIPSGPPVSSPGRPELPERWLPGRGAVQN